MRDYQLELSKGILLEDSNVLVDWEISQQDLIKKISKINSFEVVENAEFKVVRYCLRSRILGSSDKFSVSFNFVKGKMTSVNLGKETLGLNIEDYFMQMQNFLENKFGKPKGMSNLLSKVFKNEGDIIYKWHINNIKIVHSLFDFNSRTTFEVIV